jgi:DNA-directed RNA polymerase alpha subunit
MTQKNIEIMGIIVDKMVNGKTLADALKDVYEKRRISLPYNDDMLAVSVRNLHMSSRTTNALMRAHLVTLGEVVRFCNQQKITDVKSLGISGGTELFEAILNYMWAEMTEDEQMDFLIDVVEINSANLRFEIEL